jgi:hypothetical protein
VSLRPLTEHVLVRLPGPRVLWISLWALVPWLNAAANLVLDTGGTSAVWEQSRTLVVLNYAALSLAVVVTLWGSGRIARRLEALREKASRVFDGDLTERFGEMNSVAAPVLGSVSASVAFGVAAFLRDGWTSAILRGATWFVIGIAIWTFLWTYGSLLLGLHRLGRERLHPDAARVDPSLGVQPLGEVAFTGLWILLAALVPVLLTGLPDVVGVAIGALVLGGGLAGFFLSLVHLHHQMAEVKASELATARQLYAEAYGPVRAAPTLETLEQQRQLLGAADALESRARAIHEWPIDEGTVARVITIATSVVAVTIARLILDPFGL